MIAKILNLLIFVVFLFSQDLMAPPPTLGFFDRLAQGLDGFGNRFVGFFNSPPPPPLSRPSSPLRRAAMAPTLGRPQPSASISREVQLCPCPTSSSFIKNGAFESGCFNCKKPYFARNYVLAFLDSIPLYGPIIYSDRDLEWQWRCPGCKNYNCVVRQECQFTGLFGLKCQGKRSNVLAPLTEWKGQVFNLPGIIDGQGRGHELRVDARAGSFFLIDKKFIQVGWLNPATDQDLYEWENMGGMVAFSVDENGNKIPKIRTPDKVAIYEKSGASWKKIATLISGEVRRLSDLVSPGIKRKHCSCFGVFRDKDNPGRCHWALKGYDSHGIAPKSSPFFLDACGLDCLKFIACPNWHFGRLRTDPNLCRVCRYNFNEVIIPTEISTAILRSSAAPVSASSPVPIFSPAKPRPPLVGRPDAAIASALERDSFRKPYSGKCKKCGKDAMLQRINSLCQQCIDADLRTYEQKLKAKKQKLQKEQQSRRLKIGQVDEFLKREGLARQDFYGQEATSFQTIQDRATRERKAIGDQAARERLFADQAARRGFIDGERNTELNKMAEAFSSGRSLINAQDESRKALEKTEADARRKLELVKRRSLREQIERSERELMKANDLRAKAIEKEKAAAAQQTARLSVPQKPFNCEICERLKSPGNFAGLRNGKPVCKNCMTAVANSAARVPMRTGRPEAKKTGFFDAIREGAGTLADELAPRNFFQ